MSTTQKSLTRPPVEVYPLVILIGGAIIGATSFSIWNMKKSLITRNVDLSSHEMMNSLAPQ
jgi:hypothetical protein